MGCPWFREKNADQLVHARLRAMNRPSRPLVVVDMSALRSLPNGNLPGTFSAVVPNRLLQEALESSDRDGVLRKIDSVLRSQSAHGRVLVAKDWQDVFNEQVKPMDIRAGESGIIDEKLSKGFSEFQKSPVRLTSTRLSARRQPSPDDDKDFFVKLRKRFAAHMLKNRSGQLAAFRSEMKRSGKWSGPNQEGAIARLAEHEWPKRFSTRAWERELTREPNRSACSRWLTVTLWYAAQSVSAPGTSDEKLGNDFDDAHYVFTSLYTNHLWSKDTRMREASERISNGRVRTYEHWDQIPAQQIA